MIELKRIGNCPGRVDGRGLSPDRLSTLDLETILSIGLPTDAGSVPLADLFSVQQTPSASTTLFVRGDCSDIDGLGSGTAGGDMVIEGDAGHCVGEELAGGRMVVLGNVGDGAGRGMRDGCLWITGNAGERLAAPMPASNRGMRGGEIIVAGSVGARACQRMRRGTVWIQGAAGCHLAPQMIAGTIYVGGHVETGWGAGMRRGTLIFPNFPSIPPAAPFSSPRVHELSFLPLLWKRMKALQREIESLLAACHLPLTCGIDAPNTRWVRRYVSAIGKQARGEVLCLERTTSVQ